MMRAQQEKQIPANFVVIVLSMRACMGSSHVLVLCGFISDNITWCYTKQTTKNKWPKSTTFLKFNSVVHYSYLLEGKLLELYLF